MSYKHGVYGIAAVTNNPTERALSTIPAYIGSAPVHRINTNGDSDFDYSDYVNKPYLISSMREARDMGLYSDDWATYTLCEAIHAHFMNGSQSVAPIIIVNTLDPATHVEASAGTATVTMKKAGTRFIGYIEDPLCCIDNIALTIGENVGVDTQTVSYHYDGDKVVVEAEITFKNGKESTAYFTATATYSKIAFTAEDYTESVLASALNALDSCEQLCGEIPSIIAAPGISEIPELHDFMIQKAMDKLAGKWNVICVSDIPNTAKTYAEAKAWAVEHAYSSKHDKVCWPAVAYGNKKYHLSTIVTYMMQNLDTQNNDVPYVSVSNKDIFCDRAVVGEDETLLISETEANGLNQVGITTVNIVKRSLRIWGSHMSNYDYAKVGSIAPEDRFDASVRMMKFILNHLQNQYMNEVDESFTRKDVDSIVNDAQTWLDSLVNDNMLLYGNISFNNESNSDEDIANGDFMFDLEVTPTIIAKSITFKLQYTSTGLSVLTTEGGDE